MKSSASAPAIPKMAENIAYYSVCYVAKLESPEILDAPLRQTLDRMLDSMISENKGFTNYITSLNLNKDNCCVSLRNIFAEMLSDQRLNWGRILTIYCFSGCTAKHLIEKGCSSEVARQIARQIARTCGDFVSCEMSTWIEEQGGWDEFRNYFGQQKSESSIWSGWHDLFRKGIDAVSSAVSVR